MSDPTAIGPRPGASGGRSLRAGTARDRRARPLLRTTLGDVLRRIRRAQRRTLADVARAAKVSMPYLSEVERGRKEASSEILGAICDALGIELSDLLVEAGRLADRRAPVVRLDLARVEPIRGRASSPASGPTGPQCLLAA
jgi:transcriptional regulator with XRE-family HTH domain